MRLFSTPSLLVSLLFLSKFVAAAPLPRPVDEPLPGRAGVTVDENGVSTAHYGDDWLPEHMRHVQANQEEFPANAEAFPVNKDPDGARSDKIGTHSVGTRPKTLEFQVKDEKPLGISSNSI